MVKFYKNLGGGKKKWREVGTCRVCILVAGLSDLSNLEEGDLHSFKWEEVMYIWNRQWGEVSSNEKMNGG